MSTVCFLMWPVTFVTEWSIEFGDFLVSMRLSNSLFRRIYLRSFCFDKPEKTVLNFIKNNIKDFYVNNDM